MFKFIKCLTDDCFKFQVTSGTHQPYDDSAIVCTGVGTDGQIVSRILTSEGASYHALVIHYNVNMKFILSA